MAKPQDPRDPVSTFAPHLRGEFETLSRSEDQILEGLRDEKVARRFWADPARTLQELGIAVPPALKARLASRPPTGPMPSERRFRLPNGQVVTAHVKVRFTGRKDG